MTRRRRDNSLSVSWSRSEKDLVFYHDRHREDGHLMYNIFCATRVNDRSFVDELKARGFDIQTLRFSILRKPDEPAGGKDGR